MNQKEHIGGQAVIEGVMMRSKGKLSIAVRQAEDNISIKCQPIVSLGERFSLFKLPILRGMVAFFESLVLGVKTLTYSANQVLEEEEEELTDFQLFLTVFVSLLFGVSLFFLLPTFIMGIVKGPIETPLLINLGEGLIRISIFLGYVLLISRMKDIQRVFQYHGAEHKAIHCYEAGEQLTIDNAKKYTTLHPRCGTSFLLIVMLTSIILFSFFGWPNLLMRFVIRLAILPLVAGISYEVIRLAGKKKNTFTRLISVPGLFLQKFTTREPDAEQIEVALTALNNLISESEEREVNPC
ncbi:DUF1385 domain-containing protein [Natranaerobius thermophilus]|uniref:DUF1385 domain-containing protein n=1 Tax=Natranaerobius thermophilus (strain ATCC BAA-1301 / DSM 18059 / JW/NM-WN-LF) TaxID=457570 RepID=B2A3J1_NATTJ|nr:DUF1385 domain-containing protein [Natranaerobius thermophilus]ACB86420.1 protein of unknown function DUF1385 [Natranaerobius thermophilus JW/NM-WN-LF]